CLCSFFYTSGGRRGRAVRSGRATLSLPRACPRAPRLSMDRNRLVASLFGAPRALLGVVHLDALPGTPAHRLGLEAIIERAVEEARVYAAAGYHGIIVENIGDRPFLKRAVGPEVVAGMAAVGREVRRAVSVALGVQVLA